MTDDEFRELLANVHAYDNRTWTPEQMRTWREALGSMPFVWAHRAFVEHVATSTEYLMPAHLLAIGRRLAKAQRADSSEIQRRAMERAAHDREQQRAEAVAAQQDTEKRYGAALLQHVWKAVNAAPRAYVGGPVTKGQGIKAGLAALESFRAERGRSPFTGPSRLIPCGRTGCVCTHDGCERGFVIVEKPDGADEIVFCKTCNPQREHLVKQGQSDRTAAQRMLRENRPEREGAPMTGDNAW